MSAGAVTGVVTGDTDLLSQPALLARVLVRMGLAARGAEPAVELLTGGVSSSIFRVTVDGRSFCMKQALPKLKVAKDWQVPVNRVFSEIAWLQTAATIVPGHVPKVLGVDRECGAFAMEYLAPADHSNWKTQLLAGRTNAAVAAQVGEVLGRIHAATAGAAELPAVFATDANFFALRLEPYLLEAARAHPDYAVELVGLVHTTQRNPRVLVHGDVSPKNILIGPGGPVLLDAECAWWGDPAFDLAFMLNHLLLKSAHLPGQAAALSDSFHRLLAAYCAQVNWEPVPHVLARAANLLPGLLLARVDGKSPVEYLGEEPRALVRGFALALLRSPVAGPTDVLAAWSMAQRE